ncbi:MAG: DUF1272 domain-containing protein [Rhodanobacteraceae bacterium]
MRKTCERCRAPLSANTAAWICAEECTFCTDGAQALQRVCPNGGGERVRRPRPPDAA